MYASWLPRTLSSLNLKNSFLRKAYFPVVKTHSRYNLMRRQHQISEDHHLPFLPNRPQNGMGNKPPKKYATPSERRHHLKLQTPLLKNLGSTKKTAFVSEDHNKLGGYPIVINKWLIGSDFFPHQASGFKPFKIVHSGDPARHTQPAKGLHFRGNQSHPKARAKKAV